MTLRELSIDVDVEVNATGLRIVNEQADQLIRTMRELDRTYNATFNLEGITGATNEINFLTQRVNELDGRDIDLNFDTNNLFATQMDLGIIYEQVNMLDGRTIDINFDVDAAAAHAQLAVVGAHSSIAGKDRTQNINPASMVTSLGSMGAGLLSPLGLAKAGALATGLTLALPPLAAALQVGAGAFGVMGAAAGAAATGLFSFVSAAGVAALGIGGFAALGISAITDLYEEGAILTKAQKDLKKETDSVIKSWDGLKASLQDVTYGAISSGVDSVNTLLERSEPILKNATEAVNGLFDSFNKSLDGSAVKSIFGYLESSIGPLTTNIGRGIGSAAQGIGSLMTALGPLTSWMGQGFENMMGRFGGWADGLIGSDKMNSFIESTKYNLESLGGIIGGLSQGIAGFFAAFDTTASDGLDWLEAKMKDFSEWASKLDENKGFQEFLDSIKTNGPLVAGIIGNMATNITQMINALSDSGALNFLNRITDPNNFNFDKLAEKMSFSNLFKSQAGTLFDGTFNWSNIIGNIDIGSKISAIDWSQHIGFLNWDNVVSNFAWDNFITKFIWPDMAGVSWSDYITKFLWPDIKAFDWASFISPLNWPNIPVFSWAAFVTKLIWPSIPKFSWSDFVGKLGFGGGDKKSNKDDKDGSHFNGLGRVQFNGYMAELHKDEAVLQAPNAQILRDMGVLHGEGENPSINPAPLINNSVATTSAVTNNQTAPVQNVFHINVQGGNTNAETGNAVRDAIEQVFASMRDVLPLGLEG